MHAFGREQHGNVFNFEFDIEVCVRNIYKFHILQEEETLVCSSLPALHFSSRVADVLT